MANFMALFLILAAAVNLLQWQAQAQAACVNGEPN